MHRCHCTLAILLGTLFLAPAVRGDELVFDASMDNTLYSDSTGSLSNGAGPSLFAGTDAVLRAKRGLVFFDVSAILPASTVNSVTVTMYMDRTISLAHPVSLHHVLASWGEGTSFATGPFPTSGGGGGAPATTGDATWLHRFYDTAFWTNAGGDFAATASATTSVGAPGSYAWSSPQLVADVQGWVSGAGTNSGWVLVGNEAAIGTVKRFASRENADPARRPKMIVNFTRHPTDAGDLPGSRLVRLEPCVPNPFNPRTTIGYVLPEAGRARLTLHDVRGSWLATLVEGAQEPGRHAVVWNGRDARGAALPSGVYVVRLAAGDAVRTQRVVLAK